MMIRWCTGFFAFFLLVLITASAAPTAAQPGQADACPAFVEVALTEIDQACSATGRNQACYGNISVDATAREGVALTFEKRGDLAEILDINALKLAALDVLGEVWGVAMLKVQANIPGTLPGQNVTFLVFGDVEILNLGTDSVLLPMTATGNVNIRLRPTTNSNNIVGSLRGGQQVEANGILADGSWIRIKYQVDTRSNSGWVSSEFLTTDGDLSVLPVVESGEPTYGPMQAFFFKTGIGQPACATAPDDGILLQTPQGVGRVNLQVNGVDVTLGSTAYFNNEEGSMNMYMLEGNGTMTFNGVTQFVPAGTFGSVPTDENGNPNGSPNPPEPYDPDDIGNMPLDLLPDEIEVSDPLDPDEVEEAIEETEQEIEEEEEQEELEESFGIPGGGIDAVTEGLFFANRTITSSNCNGEDVGKLVEYSFYLTKEGDGNLFFDGVPMTRLAQGVYTVTGSDPAATNTLTLAFNTPTNFTGSILSTKGDGCQYQSTTQGYLASGL